MYLELIPRPCISVLLQSKHKREKEGTEDKGGRAFFALGRQAMREGIKLLRHLSARDEILMPAYICEEVIRVIREDNLKIVYYSIGRDLNVNLNDLRHKISNNTLAVVYVNYFGFPQESDLLIDLCRQKGVYIIEDCAHAIEPLGLRGDIAIFSPRKIFPIPDGGLLKINNAELEKIFVNEKAGTSAANAGLAQIKYMLRSLLNYLDDNFTYIFRHLRRLLSYWRKSNFSNVDSSLAISQLSIRIMNNLDSKMITHYRRNNFDGLKATFSRFTTVTQLFMEAPSGIAPYVFPVIFKSKRDVIMKKMREKGIMVQSWPEMPEDVDPVLFPDAFYLANNIVLFPLHQNIKKCELDYMKKIIEEVLDEIHGQF